MSSDAGLLALSQYLATGLGLLKTIVAARLLGPNDYGLAALVFAYPGLLYAFLSLKTVSVTTRYVAGFRATGQFEELKAVCKVSYLLDLMVSTAASLLVGATCWWAAAIFYQRPELGRLMALYAACFPLVSLNSTSWGVLSSWGKFGWLSCFAVMSPVIELVLVIIFLLNGLGILGMVIATAAGQALGGLGIFLAAALLLSREGLGSWWQSKFKELSFFRNEISAFFGWNYLFVTLSSLVIQVPIMLLGRYESPKEAGYFRLAVSVATGTSSMESAMGRVAYPTISARWASGERQTLRKSLRRWTIKGGLPLGILILLVIPLLPFLILLTFGPAYNPMIPAAQLMMIGVAISTIFFWLNSYYFASGQFALLTKAYFLYTCLIIGGGWIIIQSWGFLGMVILFVFLKIILIFSMVVMSANFSKSLI